jgi:hypothetical protein
MDMYFLPPYFDRDIGHRPPVMSRMSKDQVLRWRMSLVQVIHEQSKMFFYMMHLLQRILMS